jgi:hypothetical protein
MVVWNYFFWKGKLKMDMDETQKVEQDIRSNNRRLRE